MLEPRIVEMIHSPDRLAALERTEIMDTPPGEAFDRLVRLALVALDAPNGLIAFVDRERQFFKSRMGALGGPNPPRVMPVGWGFCPFTMATTRALVIDDAREDKLWADNPVVRQKGVIAYLGVPLIDRGGHVLGTMCVLDHKPRRWTDGHVETLTTLAQCVINEVELRVETERGRRLVRTADRATERERWRAMQLHSLADASLLIYSASSLEETLQLITEHALGIIGAREAATVVTLEGDWPHSTMSFAARPSVDPLEGPPIDHTERIAARSWLYSVARDRGDAVRLTRAELETHPARSDGVRRGDLLPTTSWLAAPLMTRSRTNIGVLELADCYRGEFSAEDEIVVRQLAQLASVAIENSRLHDEQRELADAFQSSLLPRGLPEVPGFEIAVRYRPAQHARVAGDFYDVFPLLDGLWAVAMGDVCGKGAEAATVAATLRHLLRVAASESATPTETLARLHQALRVITRESGDTGFCTLVCGRLNPSRSVLTLASGGHPLPCLVRADGGVEVVGAPGMLLGAFDQAVASDRQVRLCPGDAVVFFTDGLVDAEVAGEPFGPDGLMRQLAATAGGCANEIAEGLAQALEFPDARQRDDVAILVLKKTI